MRIYSIFNSIDGEVNKFHQGCFTTFIRTSGCNLNCSYCDSEYAKSETSGKEMSVEDIIHEVELIGCNKITITGGEPLEQEETKKLIEFLICYGYQITIETNGSILIPKIKHQYSLNVSWVVDYKLEYHGKMLFDNYIKLRNDDFIKCVISNRDDFMEFKNILHYLRTKGCVAKIAMSPAYGKLDVNELISWCKEFKMFDIVVNVQLHKLLNLSESA